MFKRKRSVADRLRIEIDSCRHNLLTFTRGVEYNRACAELAQLQLARAEGMLRAELARAPNPVPTTGFFDFGLWFTPLPDGIVPSPPPGTDQHPETARQA